MTYRRPLLAALLLSLPLSTVHAESPPPIPQEVTAPVAGEAFREAAWKPIFEGIALAAIRLEQPRPLNIKLLKVDLKSPGIRLLATPDNGDAPGETTAQFTSSFLREHQCQAAINAGPFDKVYADEGKPEDVSGLQISGGITVSPSNGYPALLVMDDGSLQIRAEPFPTKGIREAVSGFQIILNHGKIVATDTALHPRTGAALSENGKTLWLLAADGRQKGFSEGCTTLEMGQWFRALGASEGINLDGGGTTTMVIADADGKPDIINRPIHLGKPGRERPSGSHLGVFARPLAAPAEKP